MYSIMEGADDTKSIFIKEEHKDEFEFVDFTTQSDATPLVIGDQSQDVHDFDASIKIEEHGVQVLKEDISEETTTKEIETVFLPEQPFKKALLCECSAVYVDYCTRCSMLLRVLDNIIRKGTIDRAKLTLPSRILEFDSMSGVVYARQDLPSGVTFGPFEGLQKQGDWFSVNEGKLVCNAPPENSNWLQYVSYTFTFALANIVTVQCGEYLFFRSCREILAGEELQLYLAGDFTTTMFRPVVIEQLGETFACMPCCLGFSTKKYLARHWKVCPYPRSGKDANYLDIILCASPYSAHPLKKPRKRALEQPATQSPAQGSKPNGVPSTGALRKFTCAKCNREFPTKRLLKCHKELMHKPIKCQKCSKYFPPNELEEHIKIHQKKKKLYKCNYCDYMSEKKCIDFVLHMIHKYDKKESIETDDTPDVSTNDSPEMSTNDSPEVSTHDSPEVSTNDSPEVPTNDSPKVSTAIPAE